jgi:hypothetical protein
LGRGSLAEVIFGDKLSHDRIHLFNDLVQVEVDFKSVHVTVDHELVKFIEDQTGLHFFFESLAKDSVGLSRDSLYYVYKDDCAIG